jgi:Ulp1 family protease
VSEVVTPQQTNCYDCGVYVLAFTHALCSALSRHLPPVATGGAPSCGALPVVPGGTAAAISKAGPKAVPEAAGVSEAAVDVCAAVSGVTPQDVVALRRNILAAIEERSFPK